MSDIGLPGPYCSFCGKSKDQVQKMVQGPTSKDFICDECIELSLTVMANGVIGSSEATKILDTFLARLDLPKTLFTYTASHQFISRDEAISLVSAAYDLTKEEKLDLSSILMLFVQAVRSRLND